MGQINERTLIMKSWTIVKSWTIAQSERGIVKSWAIV